MIQKVTPKQRLAIEYLAGGAAATKAAAAAGVSRATINRWLAQERFSLAIRARSSELVDSLGKRITELAGLALDTLEDVLSDAMSKRELKLRAAQIILQNFSGVRELSELESRIAALENRML